MLRLGFQIVFGAGAGLGLELPNIAVQTVLPEKDVAIGTSLVILARSLGGAIFISAAQNVFNEQIISGMRKRVPQIDYSVILNSGATELQQTIKDVAPDQANILAGILSVYNDAFVHTCIVALALACISIVGAAGVEWRTVKETSRR